MSAIANQWVGNGQTPGATVNTGNVGSSVTYSASGSPTSVFTTAGYQVTPGGIGDIARMDVAFTASNAVRLQQQVTVGGTPEAGQGTNVAVIRATSTQVGAVVINPSRQVTLFLNGATVAGSASPAVAVGDELLIDAVWTLHTSPTTSNGRVFYRVQNKTNATWNTTGTFFFDTGYTQNIGTAQATAARLGINVAGFTGAADKFEYLGWEAMPAVTITDTSQAQAVAYFADAPGAKLATPVVSLTQVNPSVGGSDGSITATWPAVPGAATYETALVVGIVTTGFTADTTGITGLTKTYTGLPAGARTVAVRAIP